MVPDPVWSKLSSEAQSASQGSTTGKEVMGVGGIGGKATAGGGAGRVSADWQEQPSSEFPSEAGEKHGSRSGSVNSDKGGGGWPNGSSWQSKHKSVSRLDLCLQRPLTSVVRRGHK